MASVPVSNVSVTVSKKSHWENGYDGEFVIKNDNTYDILEWKIQYCYPSSEKFTWFSDGDLKVDGNKVIMTPKEYNNVIKSGESKIIGFGGVKAVPGELIFEQILPLVGEDLSLKTRGNWSEKNIAPYVDACAFPIPNLVTISKESGLRYFTLAFITADSNNKASWAGTIPLESQHMLSQIRAIRSDGGDVVVSFGGANGRELAEVNTKVEELVLEYSRVIDLYSLNRIDFDIEGGAVADAKSVDLRNRAIVMLKNKYPDLLVTYCLPVLPIGLTLAGEKLVQNARRNGTVVESFHGMSMDFGDSAAPDPEGRMAAYIISSAENLRKQVMMTGFPSPKIGLIPMIGVNDVTSEIFRVADAAWVRDFFKATPWMAYLGYWSVNRDCGGGGEGANPFNSGIKQSPYDFAKVFLGGVVKDLDPSPRPHPPPITIPGSTTPPITSPGGPPRVNDKPIIHDDVKVDGTIVAVIGDKIKISYKKPDKKKGSRTTKGCGNVNVGDKVIVFLKYETFKFSCFILVTK